MNEVSKVIKVIEIESSVVVVTGGKRKICHARWKSFPYLLYNIVLYSSQDFDVHLKSLKWAKTGLAQWIEHQLKDWRGPGFDASQGHVPWLQAHLQSGACKRQLIDVSNFLSLSPSFSKKINKICIFKSLKWVFLMF